MSKTQKCKQQRLSPLPPAAGSAIWLAGVIEKHCLQIVKGGYRWRDYWEVRVPAPGGHYRECDERLVGSGETAQEAIFAALKQLGESPNS